MSTGTVELIVNGQIVSVERGVTVAAALLNVHEYAFRASVSGESRAPLCGMGVCYECRVTIDGKPHQRACMTIVVPDMRIDTAEARG